jgi:ABC-2 type transport system permease protein
MTRVADLLPEKPAKLLPEEVATRRANWLEVARKDVADAGRSWLLYSLCGLFVAVLLVAATIHVLDPPVIDGREVTLDFGLGLDPVVWVVRWFVPLTALIVGHGSVVGERETGSLRVIMGLPITRREVLVGKLLGRTVVFSAMLSIGLILSGGVLWRFYVGFDLGAYAVFVALTLLLGIVFVAMGVGSSAFSSRVGERRARPLACSHSSSSAGACSPSA